MNRSRFRRIAYGAVACAMLGGAVVLIATWGVGTAIWPLSEVPAERKLGTDAAAIEARLAKDVRRTDLRIGIVGDIQNGVSELADLLDSLREANVDFLLQLGDAANTGVPGRYAVLRKVFEEHAPGIPVIAVPGNHDIEPDGTTTVWEEWVGPTAWRIDARGWRILGLDDADTQLSKASVALLERAAADGPPSKGTLLVAHRPLAAPDPDEGRGMEIRMRRLTATGIVPTLTISGHWHKNDQFADAAGTVHILLGENCDRTSHGPNESISRAILTLSAGGEGPGYDLHVDRLPRRQRFEMEFLRLAGANVYPALRAHPLVTWVTIGVLVAGACALAFAALRRAAPPTP